MLKPIKGKIKSTGKVVELEPITNEEFRKKYVWMEKVSGVFYKESDIEIIPEKVMSESKDTVLEVNNLCGGNYHVVLWDKEKEYCIFSYPITLEKDDATFDEVIYAFELKLHGINGKGKKIS